MSSRKHIVVGGETALADQPIPACGLTLPEPCLSLSWPPKKSKSLIYDVFQVGCSSHAPTVGVPQCSSCCPSGVDTVAHLHSYCFLLP